jgi:hypothetical protein
MKKIKEHWISLIKTRTPQNASFFLHELQDFCLDIDWKLGTDKSRPNKRSKKIRLIIPEETIEDYFNIVNDDHKTTFDQKLISFITATIDTFDPEHDTPYGASTPIETIHLPFGVTY